MTEQRKVMTEAETLQVVREIAGQYGLQADFLPGIQSVGVGGDDRTYTPVVCLVGTDPFPSHEVLATLSTLISNQTGLNRVAFQISCQDSQEATS